MGFGWGLDGEGVKGWLGWLAGLGARTAAAATPFDRSFDHSFDHYLTTI